jgi:hypothetical protein
MKGLRWGVLRPHRKAPGIRAGVFRFQNIHSNGLGNTLANVGDSKPADGDLGRGRRSQILHEIADLNPQRVGHQLECLDRYIALAAFDFTHVRSVEPRAVREDILGPAIFQAQFPDRSPHCFLDVLHQ